MSRVERLARRLSASAARLDEAAPSPEDFTHPARHESVTARVGLWLGLCFGVAFLTGLVSHYAQATSQPVPFPTSPAWGYRLTQGLHVVAGTAAVPLLLVKLWSVYPQLFRRPPRAARAALLDAAERVSIALLVSGAVFQLASGLLNSAQWYPWAFSFRTTHYAVAWVVTGALVLHVAVKLPVIRRGLGADPVHTDPAAHGRRDDSRGDAGAGAARLSRRGLLRTTWAAAAVAVLATAGGTVPWLSRVSVFAVRDGEGPQGVPVNKTAVAAGVEEAAQDPAYRLVVAAGGRETSLALGDLEAMPQHTVDLPIACVEGWSAGATWTGVRVRDLLDLVQAPGGSDVVVTSLQESGPFRATLLQGNFADDPRTLLALRLGGEPLALDHGHPARLIAPDRPGVLQTKWVARLEVEA